MLKINVGKLYTGKRIEENKTLEIENGKIVGIRDFKGQSDLIAIPGFIDMHNHGGYGIDYLSSKDYDFEDLQVKQAGEGITSMLATIGVASYEDMEASIVRLGSYIENKNTKGARILGINVEGPFLSPKYLGVMDEDSLKAVDVDLMKDWIKKSGDNIKLVTIAPELDGAEALIKYLTSHGIISSAGHSDATSKDMNKAIANGLSQVTHMFNAMRPLHHRELGILGEALTNDFLYAEMAGCDELSIHPKIWKMAYKLKTAEKMILTTDALTLKGLPNGRYSYMGMELDFVDGFAYTNYHGADRLPGKPMTFIGNIKNVMKNTGARLEDIVTMSSVNPAKRLKIDHEKGYLELGYDADINIIDQNHKLISTYIEGEKI